MAVSFTSTPTDAITVADQHLIYQVSESTTGLSDEFRFVITVYDGTSTSGTLLNKLYLSPNTNEDAFFNLGEVVRGLCQVDDRNYQGTTVLHSYTARYFTRSNGNIRAFTVGVGSWNGTTETLNVAAERIYLIDGHFQISQGFDPSFTEYYPYDPANKTWLTDRVEESNIITINAAEEDEGVVAFLNKNSLNSQSISSTVKFEVIVYDASGTQLSTNDIDVNTTNGAQLVTASTPINGFLCYFAIYPSNLDAIGGFLTSQPTWDYYDVIPQASLFDAQSGNKLRFKKNCRPVKHSPVQLAWANTVGGWDYLRFDGKKQKTVTREEKSYRKVVGDYDASSFSFTSFDRETQPYHVEAKEQYVLNGILTIEELTLFQYCMRSKNVMARIDGSWVPVIVQTNSMKIEEETTSKIFLTTFNVELAQYIRC